jgi:cation diffusion facilitator family transporter
MAERATGARNAASARGTGANERAKDVQRVLLVTLALNLAVASGKIAYGTAANALSIRADGFHSATDAVNNVVGLVGLWFAARPPDRGHPYGHHKLEILAALVVGVSLLAMAYDVVRGAVERLLGVGSELPLIGASAFLVLGGTLVVNVIVAVYEKTQGKRLGSAFLLADAAHTRSDVLVTLGVISAALMVRLGYPIFDVIAAGFVAIFIAWAGIVVLKSNLDYLADASQIDPALIEKAALTVPGVASTHKIRTRGIPGAVYVDLHIQIAPHLNVVQAHQVTHWVIDAIKESIPGVLDVTVHTEPARPEQHWAPLPWEQSEDVR